SMLPLFLTEYGYSRLDRFERHTIEGRAHQAQWFNAVLPALTDGQIAGAMAFVFMPYYENGTHEFGLLAEHSSQTANITVPEPIKSAPLHPASALPGPAESVFPQLQLGSLSPVVIDFLAREKIR